MKADPGVTRATLFVLAGPLVVAVHFTLAYVPQAVLCARGIDGPLPIWLATVTAVAAGALTALIALPEWAGRAAGVDAGTQAAFLISLMRALSYLSAFGLAATSWAMATIPVCGSLQ